MHTSQATIICFIIVATYPIIIAVYPIIIATSAYGTTIATGFTIIAVYFIATSGHAASSAAAITAADFPAPTTTQRPRGFSGISSGIRSCSRVVNATERPSFALGGMK